MLAIISMFKLLYNIIGSNKKKQVFKQMDNSNSVLNRINIQNDINLYIHALGIGFD